MNGNVSCFAIDVYENSLPFKPNYAHDQCHGLLIASSNDYFLSNVWLNFTNIYTDGP